MGYSSLELLAGKHNTGIRNLILTGLAYRYIRLVRGKLRCLNLVLQIVEYSVLIFYIDQICQVRW